MKNKAIVLLSGGLDSATALFIAKDKGYKCHCLIFDYGQRHINEIAAARNICLIAGVDFLETKIDLPWKGSSLLDKKADLPQALSNTGKIPSTYVPGRNIIFLSHALSLAEAVGAKAIFIGAHAQDYSGYPDCRPEFFRAFKKVISSGTKSGIDKIKIEIETPLLNLKKAEIIKIGHKLGVPYHLTWSCYHGGQTPCGTCDSCRYRAKGFREAHLPDPLLRDTLRANRQGVP